MSPEQAPTQSTEQNTDASKQLKPSADTGPVYLLQSETHEDEIFVRLVAENRRLKIEKENAALRSEIAAFRAPWWRNPGTVTTLVTILAAVIPATTAVHGYFQKERELKLEEGKNKHAIEMDKLRQTEQIRTGYLDRLKDEGAMVRTLRFVAATSGDEKLKPWAEAELKLFGEELGREKKRLDLLEDTATNAEREYLSALDPEAKRQSTAALQLLELKAKMAKEEAAAKRQKIRVVEAACKCVGDPLCSCF